MYRERLAIATATLAHLAERGADPSEIAAAATAIWRAIYAELSRIIGSRGMYALYERSLHSARTSFPWLGVVHDTGRHSGEFDGLREALSLQSATVGAAANTLLLEIFCDQLSNLVGESLTERLLAAVWDNTSSGPAV